MNDMKQIKFPNLYLVGFMGVGKSALGRRVAKELDYQFIDSDQSIEKECGRPISEIFKNDGEASFRQYELGFIKSGHPSSRCVVACGGGLVIQDGMKERLKDKGVVICLFASLETIIERISRNSDRPLINVSNPEIRIRELFAERESVYMKSGPCISTEGRTIAEVVRHILRTYKDCTK